VNESEKICGNSFRIVDFLIIENEYFNSYDISFYSCLPCNDADDVAAVADEKVRFSNKN